MRASLLLVASCLVFALALGAAACGDDTSGSGSAHQGGGASGSGACDPSRAKSSCSLCGTTAPWDEGCPPAGSLKFAQPIEGSSCPAPMVCAYRDGARPACRGTMICECANGAFHCHPESLANPGCDGSENGSCDFPDN